MRQIAFEHKYLQRPKTWQAFEREGKIDGSAEGRPCSPCAFLIIVCSKFFLPIFVLFQTHASQFPAFLIPSLIFQFPQCVMGLYIK